MRIEEGLVRWTFNATVVFEEGPTRWTAAAASVLLFGLLLLARRQ